MENNKIVDQCIVDISTTDKIIFLDTELQNLFIKNLYKYNEFAKKTFFVKNTIIKHTPYNEVNKKDLISLEQDSSINICFNIIKEPTLDDLYCIISYLKSSNKHKFIILYNKNELTNPSLLNLKEFFNIQLKYKYFGKEVNIPLFNKEFSKENLELYLNTYFKNYFTFYEKNYVYYSLEDIIKRNNINIYKFSHEFGFIALNENDCVNWHKDICKNLFKISYSDLYKIYFYRNKFYAPEDRVLAQSENSIYISTALISFSHRNSFDKELKELFNFNNLDDCFIPRYISDISSEIHKYEFIHIDQLKNFYNKHPEFFNKLIYSLSKKVKNFNCPLIIITD